MHTAQCDREFVMRKLGHTGYIECIQENHAFWQVTKLRLIALYFVVSSLLKACVLVVY